MQIGDRGGRAGVVLIDAAVDLVAEHVRRRRRPRSPRLLEPGAVHEGARRVVRVAERDQLRPLAGQRAQLAEVRQPAVLLAQAQRADVGAEALRDRVVLLVVRDDRDDAVARLHEREVDELVGADRAVRDQHVLARLAVVEGGDAVAQPVRALDRAVRELQRPQLFEERVRLAGEVEQLGDGERGDAGLGEVPVAACLVLVHPLLDPERADPHARTLTHRIARVPYTLRNLKRDVGDVRSNFDGPPDLEFRLATVALELEQSGLCYQRIPPGYRFPYGHTHERQEEVYVVLRGSGRMKLDDEIVELAEWDAVRVPPRTWRGYEAGPEGLEILVIGAPNLGDAPREASRAARLVGRQRSCALLRARSLRVVEAAARQSRAGDLRLGGAVGRGIGRVQPLGEELVELGGAGGALVREELRYSFSICFSVMLAPP